MKPVIWHVIFHPSKKWWARRFSHVSVAGWSNETWVHLDLSSDAFVAEVLYAYDEVNDFLGKMLLNTTIVKVRGEPRKSSYMRPMTCVNFVKHVIGLPSRALLPDALFHDLVRNHSGEIMNEDPEVRGKRSVET